MWFHKCIDEMRLAEEESFLPPKYTEIIKKALHDDLTSATRGLKKDASRTMIAKSGAAAKVTGVRAPVRTTGKKRTLEEVNQTKIYEKLSMEAQLLTEQKTKSG